ncbi:ribosomal RNA-processing protein 8 [Tyto alba]|uniref:ribosomal RNA-processing protein 8 n=1 Tax=Tyto alba TaxID=56313 RepID=UPI001C68137D|nr:ribosomal RNA-processing protein 8 [Tyto alba]
MAAGECNDGAGDPARARARPAPTAAAARKRRRAAGDGEPARKRRRRRRAAPPPDEQRLDTDAAGEPGALGPERRPSGRRRGAGQRDEPLPAGPGGARDAGPGHPGLPHGEAVPPGRSAALRARMEERLLGARFRYINQQLYTSPSREAARLFQSDPEAFEIYHRGFARQVGRWPENPVQRIIRYLRRRPASLVVADFGCGDCKIASSVRNKVHSFDLVPLSPLVTVCDMAKVPLAGESVDVAVFCLALMGTNLQEILEEANRVLKQGGTLMVAEVASRFEDIRAFMNAMAQLGFRSVSKDLSSAFFYLLEFAKTGPPRPGRAAPGLRLRPCLYKRR